MSAFVDDVPYRSTGVYAPITPIETIIADLKSYATAAQVELGTAITNLKNINDKYTPSFDEVTAEIPDLIPINIDPPPDLTVSLNENWPDNNVADPDILPNSPDFSFTDPDPIGRIDPSFDYTPGIYSSCLWTDLCSQVRDDLINGGTGLNASVYALIIDRDREARRSAEDRSRRQAYDAVGAQGFDLPGGMAAAVILQHEGEILAKDVDAINSVTIKDFELADTNTRFIKELSLKMEEVQRNAYDNDETRLFEIARVSQEMIIAIYEQNVKIYIAQWEGVKIKLEAIKIQVDAIIAHNDGEIKVFLGRIEAYKTEIEAIASENKSKTDTVIAKANVYEAEVRAVVAGYSALVEEIRVAMEVYRLELMEVLEKEKINLDAFTSWAALDERIAESIANIAAQSVASALSGLNTSQSIGYSGSESLSYSAGITNSLSEGHSYEEE